MRGTSGIKFTNVLEAIFVMLLVVLPVLPVVDLLDQHRGSRNGQGKKVGTVMSHNGGDFFQNNQTRRMVAEMRDETQNRGMGGTRTIASGNWNGTPQRENQKQQHVDRNDASSPSKLQAVSFPNAFDMFPGLSSSSSSAAAESESYEEEFEEEQRRIIMSKSKATKQQRHHQHLKNQHAEQHQTGAAASRIGESSGDDKFALDLHQSSSRLWTGSNKKQLAFLVEPPLPLASSTRVTGPYFDSNQTTLHISSKAGDNVILDCTVILLQGRTVSWLRRGNDSVQLLTVGNITYVNDPRMSFRFRYPNNWRLGIDSVNKADEGEYQCQVSTHPVKTLIYHLKVIAPVVVIQDENGHSVSERHYKVDSSLHLTCRASHVDKFVDKVVWMKGDRPLSGTDNRIKIKVTKSEEDDETSVYLSVLSLHTGDSGNYSCRAGALAKYTVMVHVVNGELPAAVQHESGSTRALLSPAAVWLVLQLRIFTTMLGIINQPIAWVER